MSKSKDDLEAVRSVIEALDGFDQNDQERIIRWAKEKLGLGETSIAVPIATSHSASQSPPFPELHKERSNADIKSFVLSKDPKNDQHFAATIAYYYRFEAPPEQRKDEITSSDLQEACRQAKRARLQNPGQTLRNAHQGGLLNKGAETGAYAINTVGENLVAMTLPTSGAVKTKPRSSARKPTKNSGTSSSKNSQKKVTKTRAVKKPSK